MTMQYRARPWFTRPDVRTVRKAPRKTRPALEALEDRCVPSTLSGTLYNDLNGNGVKIPADPVLKGWTIDLFDSVGNMLGSVVSGADGSYSFANVAPGFVDVDEISPPGWVTIEPGYASNYEIQVISGVNQTGLDFGNFQTVTTAGTVYDDLTGDGVKRSADPGLQGWTVDLEDSSGNVLASAVTTTNGSYAFTNVSEGNYIIQEIVPPGWRQTEPSFQAGYSFQTMSGANQTGLDFGNFQFGRATIASTAVSWGTSGNSGALATQTDGLRLLPAGRDTDLDWLGINKMNITLSQAETLSASDVSVAGINIANYGPVTISGSSTNYVITLAQPINAADRVTVTIGNANIATYTRRLDVLPGDVNDDGVVNAQDAVLVRNEYLGLAMPNVFGDINGDGTVDLNDYNTVRRLIGTSLPPLA